LIYFVYTKNISPPYSGVETRLYVVQ